MASTRPRPTCSGAGSAPSPNEPRRPLGSLAPGRGGAAFFLQPGELSFQVADPLAQTAQLGGYTLVRPADVAEKSLCHDGRSSFPSWHHTRLKARCMTDGDRMEKASAAG